MDDAMKNAILNIHNQLRSDIAMGKIQNYNQAANMQALTWDNELASKAALNVHQCEMKHDECRSTGKTVKRNSKTNIYIKISTHHFWYDK